MVLPFPKAVEIGMDIFIPMVGAGARSERHQASSNG
jgi:hypothetical protein